MTLRRACAAVLLALLLAAAGCGTKSAQPAGSGNRILDQFTQILGHEPAGLARKIAETGTIRVANDKNNAPQSALDKSGELVGFDVDVARRLGELLGVRVAFVNPVWATVPAQLNAGAFDVSIGSMTITDERQKTLDFSDPYYFTKGQIMMKEGGRQITTVEDLYGHVVAVSRATSYETFLRGYPQVRLKLYDFDADVYPDLKSGKVEYLMTADTTEQQAILEGWPFEMAGPALYYEDLGFAIRKGQPDLLVLLDHAIATMHADGSLSTASIEWYNGLDLTVK